MIRPAAHAGAQGLEFINSDVTAYLRREPRAEWVGYEVTNHGAQRRRRGGRMPRS